MSVASKLLSFSSSVNNIYTALSEKGVVSTRVFSNTPGEVASLKGISAPTKKAVTGSVEERLLVCESIKQDLAETIRMSGVDVPTGSLFADYGSFIRMIETGSAAPSGSVPGPYDPDNIPAGADLIFVDEPGAPQVKTDEDGGIVEFSFTQASEQSPVEFTGSATLDTGFVPFDGSDFALTLTFTLNPADQVYTTVQKFVDVLSCVKFTKDPGTGVSKLDGGFELRFTSASRYLAMYYSNGSSGNTKNMKALSNGTVSEIVFEVTKSGARVEYSIQGTKGTLFDKTAYSFNMTSASYVGGNDILLAGRLGSDGTISYSSNIKVLNFSVRKV